MPAVEKSRGSTSTPTIPRPPNSWILYRSDMVNMLAPPAPGTTRSQADVSRIISILWKTERPEVKSEYERRAELKKVEHTAMYPNYRYTPKSKEIKEEIKKAKEDKRKKKKQRDTTQHGPEGSRTRITQDLPFTSHAFPLLPPDSSLYLDGYPSPPMFAADSPSPEPEAPQLPQLPQLSLLGTQNQRVNEHVIQPQGRRSYYRPHTSAPHNTNPNPTVQQPHYLAPPQAADPSHYQASIAGPSTQAYHPQQSMQPQAAQLEQNGNQQYASTQNTPVASPENEDYLSFDLQPFAGDSLGQWALQNPEFQPTLDHFLTNTGGDCYQLQMNSLDQGSLDQAPVGPLEVEVGQLADFNYSQLQWDPTSSMGTFQSLFRDALPDNGGFQNMAGPSSQASPSEVSDLASADVDETFHLDQYINFNPTFDYTAPPSVEKEVIEAPVRTPYVPPSGAMHAGKRRVAGSWNSSFAMQDPIDV
ncbi:hypothetical protein C0991_000728 [Blastosporella zonata]|nr:hypothetical protein C0991_000728 [Blastosporella zonata]